MVEEMSFRVEGVFQVFFEFVSSVCVYDPAYGLR